MHDRTPKEILRRALEEIFNLGKLEVADEWIDPGYLITMPAPVKSEAPTG
ncbi:MAG: hypothetical protein MPW16_04050 [Candidatus Manganitrophus sp.]|nr:MAG: hypothetical protein MPW16_04050 [Candidatus Manganitrophus sp.]